MGKSNTVFIGSCFGGNPGFLEKMRSFKGVHIVKTLAGKDTMFHIYGDRSVRPNNVTQAIAYFHKYQNGEVE